MTALKHINAEYGDFATPCDRCGLEWVFQQEVPRLNWAGYPCKTEPYTNAETFKINKLWIQATYELIKNNRRRKKSYYENMQAHDSGNK